jgi:hypothetical protein
MSKVAIQGAATGTGVFTLASPATNTDRTLTLPDEAGTVLTSAGVPASAMPAGSVIQVVSLTKTDTWSQGQSANSLSGTDVTGLVATITPTSASNKILVLVNLNLASGASLNIGHGVGFALYRAGTKISSGDAAGSRTSLTSASLIYSTSQLFPMGMNYLDSPATTSAVSYSIRLWQGSGGTVNMYVNRTGEDNDAASGTRAASSITVMEIAA